MVLESQVFLNADDAYIGVGNFPRVLGWQRGNLPPSIEGSSALKIDGASFTLVIRIVHIFYEDRVT
jgi:hypothetical protein